MTVTLAPVHEPIGELLTATDYDALPANPRRELVDGVVRMTATPPPFHQDVAYALRTELNRCRPDDLRVTGEVEVRLDDLLRRKESNNAGNGCGPRLVRLRGQTSTA